MSISVEQNQASHGFISTYFSFSFSINLFASFHAPKSRGDQDARNADSPPARTFDAYLDDVGQDTSQDALSPEVQEMQRAARTAYLLRLSRISDRASLQCLEKATKARLEWAARLDRESLEKLEFATKMLEMITPPEKERWQYNARSSPIETEASSSSESKRVHSIQDSPCELVLMRRSSGVRSSQGLRLDSQDEKGVKDETLNSWLEQDIARVVEESDSRGKIENPFGAFGKDVDEMIAESERLKSMSPIKIQESSIDGGRRGAIFENPFKSFFNSKREDQDKQEEGDTGSVELNPDFADYDQEEQAGSKDEEEEEWTDLGDIGVGPRNLEDA